MCVYAVTVPLVFSQTTCCSMIGLSVCKKNRFASFFALLTNLSLSRSLSLFFLVLLFSLSLSLSPLREIEHERREREKNAKYLCVVCFTTNSTHTMSQSDAGSVSDNIILIYS